jgi:hypothetical protein
VKGDRQQSSVQRTLGLVTSEIYLSACCNKAFVLPDFTYSPQLRLGSCGWPWLHYLRVGEDVTWKDQYFAIDATDRS